MLISIVNDLNSVNLGTADWSASLDWNTPLSCLVYSEPSLQVKPIWKRKEKSHHLRYSLTWFIFTYKTHIGFRGDSRSQTRVGFAQEQGVLNDGWIGGFIIQNVSIFLMSPESLKLLPYMLKTSICFSLEPECGTPCLCKDQHVAEITIFFYLSALQCSSTAIQTFL